jgi:hypothetical protein
LEGAYAMSICPEASGLFQILNSIFSDEETNSALQELKKRQEFLLAFIF